MIKLPCYITKYTKYCYIIIDYQCFINLMTFSVYIYHDFIILF